MKLYKREIARFIRRDFSRRLSVIPQLSQSSAEVYGTIMMQSTSVHVTRTLDRNVSLSFCLAVRKCFFTRFLRKATCRSEEQAATNMRHFFPDSSLRNPKDGRLMSIFLSRPESFHRSRERVWEIVRFKAKGVVIPFSTRRQVPRNCSLLYASFRVSRYFIKIAGTWRLFLTDKSFFVPRGRAGVSFSSRLSPKRRDVSSTCQLCSNRRTLDVSEWLGVHLCVSTYLRICLMSLSWK